MPPLHSPRSFARDLTVSPLRLQLRRLAPLREVSLFPRAATNVNSVPEGYGRTPSGPDPGAVVGIVLGSIAGFILLLWVIYWCVNLGNPTIIEEGSVTGASASVVSYRSRPRVHRKRRSHYSRSPHRREKIEITRRSIPIVVPSPSASLGPNEIIVEEHRSRSRTRSRSRPRSLSRSVSRPRPVHHHHRPPTTPSAPRTMSGDDEIVVLEEHTPPRRRESRGHRRRSSGGRYRDPDTRRFTGGEGSSRDRSRRRSSPRR
ncbi:hypothetical protein GGS23DRAFT_592302 [Durotheca rogersii]|uniref:uncharacterized protein n=1 Tax=Durotheca rogersii TaxID=419775 RepID=UPI00221F1847|nr:uncharacterized protein GGS23DRAFT_592302 [Durotheca rogersii]KAI5868531.1 hypothetical protein GGS23DRAFT_592302 [Durotheca rogersii]